MAAVLTNIGEEYVMKNNVDGASLTVGLYNDGTDALSDTSDLANLTTEPAGSAYARQTDTYAVTQNGSSNAQADNNNQLTYDTSDSTQAVDAYFIVANFQSSFNGDSSATDHIIATGLLSQSRDLSSVDTLNIAAGSAGFDLD